MQDDKRVRAGFWRRLGGYLIDVILLGAAGGLFGYLAFDWLSALPGPTRLIGLAIGIVYFGVLSAGMCGGRTLGMWVTGIKVVTTSGRGVNLFVSLWRAALLNAPIIVNGLNLEFSDGRLATAYAVLAVVLVFGFYPVQILLLIFNAPYRRLLHDLLSGTVVVRADIEGAPGVRFRLLEGVALGLVVLLSAGAYLASTSLLPKFAPSETLKALEEARSAVRKVPGVLEAGVSDATSRTMSGEGSTVSRTLVVRVRVARLPEEDDKALARAIVNAVVESYELAPDQAVRVEFVNGFDIGVAAFWRSRSETMELVELEVVEAPNPNDNDASDNASEKAEAAP